MTPPDVVSKQTYEALIDAARRLLRAMDTCTAEELPPLRAEYDAIDAKLREHFMEHAVQPAKKPGWFERLKAWLWHG